MMPFVTMAIILVGIGLSAVIYGASHDRHIAWAGLGMMTAATSIVILALLLSLPWTP